MKKFAPFALLVMLMASSTLALAQTSSAQNQFSRMPMFSFWGSQATATAPSTQTTLAPQFGQANQNSSLQDFWSLMPMFQFFNFSQ